MEEKIPEPKEEKKAEVGIKVEPKEEEVKPEEKTIEPVLKTTKEPTVDLSEFHKESAPDDADALIFKPAKKKKKEYIPKGTTPSYKSSCGKNPLLKFCSTCTVECPVRATE